MGREQRTLVAKGLVELGNIVAGAMVFGQFVSEAPLRGGVFALGLLLTTALYFGGIGISKLNEVITLKIWPD